jgi:hypothetical protein
MSSSLLKRSLAAAAAVVSLGLAGSVIATPAANADPRQHTNQLVGVGSDTTQEITNAFAGQAAGTFYDPLASSPATGRSQITSWDAAAPGLSTAGENTIACITPRAGFNAFQRPNGSSQGRFALSRAFSGAGLTFSNPTGDPACAGKSTAGIVDFARSSSGPSGTSNGGLTYVPFARDALTYAYTYVDGVSGDAGDNLPGGYAQLNFAELQQVFRAAGTQGTEIRSLLVVPCDIQNGSGTQKDWPTKIGGTPATTTGQVSNASGRCDALGVVGVDPSGKLQESKPSQLEAKADLFEAANPGTPALLVVGHSVSNYIAQANGASPSFLDPDVDLGSAVPGQAPFTGTAPNLVGNPAFYEAANSAAAPTPGRKVYFVLLSAIVDDDGNDNLKQMFIGATSQVCQAEDTIERFGFTTLPQSATSAADRCGDASARGDLITSA